MHELGVVMEVVKTIERVAKEQSLTKIETIVLQIGEYSSMIPSYVKSCYPAAVDGTMLEETKLEIEVLLANAFCLSCNKVFNISINKNVCPNCGSNRFDVLSGKELIIKEIIAY